MWSDREITIKFGFSTASYPQKHLFLSVAKHFTIQLQITVGYGSLIAKWISNSSSAPSITPINTLCGVLDGSLGNHPRVL